MEEAASMQFPPFLTYGMIKKLRKWLYIDSNTGTLVDLILNFDYNACK